MVLSHAVFMSSDLVCNDFFFALISFSRRDLVENGTEMRSERWHYGLIASGRERERGGSFR